MRHKLLYLDSVPISTPAVGDAGYDLSVYGDVTIQPDEIKSVSIGSSIQIPDGHVGLVLGRSGNAFRQHLFVLHTGVVDSSYRGDIYVLLYNASTSKIDIPHGARIAQLLLLPIVTPTIEIVDTLDDTARGSAGLGSTGLAGYVTSLL